MKIKIKHLNTLILVLLFPILIVDMLNGFILEKQIFFPVSISQLYKLIILGLMFFRLSIDFNNLKLVGYIFLILLSGTVFKIFSNKLSFVILLEDTIKIFKYLMPLIAFLYFREIMYLNNQELLNKYIKWIKYSYYILAVNILIKLIGLGYPMYLPHIGTRGFFHAGNEVSALLLILSVILGYYYWEIEKSKIKFVFHLTLSFFLGLLISSKTGMMGIILVFMLIIFDIRKINFKHKEFRRSVFLVLGSLPIFVWLGYVFIIKSVIMDRLSYLWARMDLVTFIMSNRNVYFERIVSIYNEEYSYMEKIIGVGQSYYEKISGGAVEIDPVDIFFTYGYVGVIVFLGLIIILLAYAKFLLKTNLYPYARLSYFMIIFLFLLSCLSGHIFNSGVSGIFVGFLFSLMFMKDKNHEKEYTTN